MLYITEEQVRQHLSVNECIDVLRNAFAHEIINIPRYRLKSTHSLLHVMSASIPDLGIMGLKAYGTSKSGASFAVLLFAEATGELLSVIEADALGQIRTGAASGLATDLLANADAKIGAVIGTGFQAETQLRAICHARKFEVVRIYSRSAENRKSFIRRMQNQVDTVLQDAPGGEQCAAGADVICTITGSKTPVLMGEWLKSGCHVNAAGSNWASKRELDDEAVRRASLICVDHLEQSRIESGDLIHALQDWSNVVELGDVVRGISRRKSPDDITLFKSNGIAAEDIAAAQYLYQKLSA
jgi:ornithine cyclodeaminase/alanine dehydrogenase-like protein (mu-crystallin family)